MHPDQVKFLKKFSTMFRIEHLEPILLTQHNFSENDAKRRLEDRQKVKQNSLRLDRRSLYLKNLDLNGLEGRGSAKRGLDRRVQNVDQSKVREILQEIEDFEKEYAIRVRLRNFSVEEGKSN